MWNLSRQSRSLQTRGAHASRALAGGFSLVEVIIVSVVLTVLLATVWSLFVMQQRTLERGQRLSRNTRVVLALQRQMQDDFARLVLRRWDSAESPMGGSAGASSDKSLVSDFAQRSSLTATDGDVNAEMLPAEFRFVGGSDWLIIDVRRPAYQSGAFDSVGADPLADSLDSLGGAGATAAGSASAGGQWGEDDPDQLPQRAPTPFQRIAYLWLSDEEIEEVAGLRFGHDADALGNPPGSGSSSDASSGSNRSSSDALAPASGAGRAGEADMGQASDLRSAGVTGLDGAGSTGARRTLVRLVTDWSWPREGDLAGEIWDAANSEGGTGESEALDFGAGLPGSSGSTTPQRRQWLRRLLAPSSDAFRDFHLESGSAIATATATATGTLADDGSAIDPLAGFAAESLGSDAAASEGQADYLLPDRWQPQVDWFPEVVAGKFQYFDGTRWQATFTEGEERKLPLAVRFEYTVDARWFPVTVSDAVDADVSGADAPAAFSPLPAETLGAAAEALASSDSLLGVDLNARPEFPHVVVFTFSSQATRRDSSLELPGDAESVNEGGDASEDPLQPLGVGAGSETTRTIPEFGSSSRSPLGGF